MSTGKEGWPKDGTWQSVEEVDAHPSTRGLLLLVHLGSGLWSNWKSAGCHKRDLSVDNASKVHSRNLTPTIRAQNRQVTNFEIFVKVGVLFQEIAYFDDYLEICDSFWSLILNLKVNRSLYLESLISPRVFTKALTFDWPRWEKAMSEREELAKNYTTLPLHSDIQPFKEANCRL